MINIEVRNARTGRVVRTFEDAQFALDWAKAHSSDDACGALEVYAVETFVRERLLIEAPVIPMMGARGLRAGRGRS